MMSRRPTRLFNRATEQVVAAEILNEISRDELIDVHMEWQPERLEALKNLRSEGKPWPENWHWDWSTKADNLNFLAYRCFAVECEGRTQGLMMISTIGWRGRIDIQAGKPVLYVEYIESAPWCTRLRYIKRPVNEAYIPLAYTRHDSTIEFGLATPEKVDPTGRSPREGSRRSPARISGACWPVPGNA